MAKFEQYFPKLVQWEGAAFENVPGDNGGPTKYGVILSEWISRGYDKDGNGKIDVEDLKLITAGDAMGIAKSHYWDKVSGDLIKNQSIAEFLVDWGYNVGIGTAIKKLQGILGLATDGSFGPKTLAALNSANQEQTWKALRDARIQYYQAIVKAHPEQSKFLKGWISRTESFKFSL